MGYGKAEERDMGVPEGMGYGGGPEEWDIRVVCYALSCLHVSSVAETGAGTGCQCFPGVALPLMVSWQCNGDSGLAFGGGTAFPCPGPRLSRSRTLRADPDSLSCLVGALGGVFQHLGSPPCSGKLSCLTPVISIVYMDSTSFSPLP